MQRLIETNKRHRFMFEELVKRDFKQKYKRTMLGMAWSLLSPLLQLLVMSLIFTQFFGRKMQFYTIGLPPIVVPKRELVNADFRHKTFVTAWQYRNGIRLGCQGRRSRSFYP